MFDIVDTTTGEVITVYSVRSDGKYDSGSTEFLIYEEEYNLWSWVKNENYRPYINSNK